ncbi:MAG: DUF2090 domain-containing protein, partial [Caulobacteraceae bacterium]
HGCAPAMATWPEMEHFLGRADLPFRLRDDAALEHIHWATTRDGVHDELTVLAVDHRSQFDDLIAQTGADPARVPAFKLLALRAVDAVAKGDPRFGILADGRYGFDTLAKAADYPYWIGRPIELPQSRPLQFECSADVATELAEWPLNHVVKCLVFYHPDDPASLREAQERQLVRLADACRKTRHEFLLEVILPKGMPVDSGAIADCLQRFYALGIKPDWWKLEPSDDVAAWRNIEAVIQQNDPWCRGVVLLGLSAPIEDLMASIKVAATIPIIKGFAVGRTIFYDVARDWLAGRIGDSAAVAAMATRFDALTKAWRIARGSREQAA